jgi:subtilase-type serine protease
VLDGSDLTVNGGVVSFNGVQTGGTTTSVKRALKGVGTLGTPRGRHHRAGQLDRHADHQRRLRAGRHRRVPAEVAPGGRSDQLHVTGTATLGGTLVALPEPGTYYLGEQFNFIRPTVASTASSPAPTSARSRPSCSSAWPTAPMARALT